MTHSRTFNLKRGARELRKAELARIRRKRRRSAQAASRARLFDCLLAKVEQKLGKKKKKGTR